ncbi:MAG: hypothetical protein IKO77_04425 [Bacteroidales bacterium]|nr:hypothetical protein [Bacteroidales bacterium]
MNALPVNFRGALIRAAASLVFLLCCTASLAQESDPFTYSSRIRPSAQAWTVSHHGGMSPDLFTGAMAWSLPLYTYKDEDFTIPISLDYRFDGCRPSQPSGTVGLGWSLNCGGVITRTIVGLPDDFIRKTGYVDTDDELHESWEVGYYFAAIDHGYIPPLAIDDRLSMETYMNESYCIGQMSPVILDLGNNSLTMLMGASPLLSENYVFYRNGIIEGGPYFDPESDIYHFSLPDVSGDFVILSDGSTKVYNCTDPEGEISVQIHFSLLQGTSCSTRIIISRRGYRYEFGWDRNHLEYNYDTTLESYTDPSDPLRHCFTALFLNRIVAPNGRQVSFSRDAVSPCNSMLWKPAVKYRVSGITGQPRQTLPGLSNTISRPLQSIAVDGDTLVTFHYGNKSHAEFGYSSFQGLTISQYRHLSPLGQGPPQPDSTAGYNTANRLTSVTIHNREQDLIDSISLTHSYSSSQSGHSPKMFLRTVQGNAGRYTFEYEHASSSDAWPAVNAENVTDHWGYWAGTGIAYSDNSSNRQQHSLYDLPSTAKEPDTLYTMYGALHRIGYPSGGCTLLSYEPNRVSRRIDIDAFATGSGDGSYYLDPCQNKLAGGVRIKKIVNQTGAAGSFCDSLVFDYCSSGILMRMPRYFIDASAAYHRRFWKYLENTGAWLIEDNYGDLTLSSFNNSGLSACGADGHVGYSKVRTRHGDGSFSEYIFSDISDYPDTYLHDYGESDGERFSILKAMVGNTQEEPEKRGFFIVSEPASQAAVNSNVRLAGICLADFSCMRGRPLSKKVYAADSSLVQAVRHTYHADTAAVARGVFNVFSNFIASGRTFIQPRLDSVITMEYLPGGGAVSDTTLYIYNALGQKTLTEHHGSDGSIRGIRLRYEHESDTTAPRANISEAASTRTGLDGTEYVTGFQRFAYDGDSARRHLPVLAMDYGRPVPWAVSAVPGTGWFTPPAPDDSVTRRLSYNEKHRQERLLLPAGAYVSFVWDTSGRYPLTREDNGPMMISTYQWKDMVGLDVKTDPTLRSEWYAYDGKWRLAEVRRADSTRIMAYDYHLRCEDSTAGPSHIKRTTWRTSSKNNRDIIYYDGLGYPIQRVRTSIQTNGGHIVTPVRYDALRRDDVEAYLPYEAQYSTYNSADSIAQSQYYKLQFGNSEIYPYAKRTYGTSPAGRLLSSRKPGRDYADSAKVVTYDYRTNNAADSILDLTVTVDNLPQLIAGTAFLPAGRLLLTKTTDEDGCTGEVFTNAAGRIVLSRQRTEGQRLDTYYVYDLRDSLVCVLQPEGSAAIQPGTSHTLLPPVARNAADTIPAIDAVLDKYAFLYAWDSRGRLAAKKRPGAKAEEYLYDDRDRVVLSRDGNLRTQGLWLYNEYDGYDALLKKSLVTVSLGLDTLRRAARGEIDSTVTVIRDTTWLWPYFGSQNPDMVVYGRTASLAAGDSLFCQGYDGFDYAGPADSAGNDPVLGHYVVFEMAY